MRAVRTSPFLRTAPPPASPPSVWVSNGGNRERLGGRRRTCAHSPKGLSETIRFTLAGRERAQTRTRISKGERPVH